ncbi:MAG TPA: hypothetical protein VF426_05250, partial [Marmoricola sp.]
IQVNAVAWSKVYRRSFYDAAGLRFPEGLVYEDQPVSSRAYARAAAFDVLPDAGVVWRTRADGSSLSQQTAAAANLADHNRAVELSLAELTDSGHERAAQIRALQLLTHNLAFFAHSLVGADDAFKEQFRRGLQMLLDRVPHEEYVHTVNVRSKTIHELFLAGRTDDLERFITDGPANVRVRPTTVTADGVLSEIGVDGVSVESRLIPDQQTALRARILEDTTTASGERVLRGYAFVRNVDLTDRDFTTTATLVSADGSRTTVPLTHTVAPEANVAVAHDFCDFSPSGFTLTLPATPAPVPTAGTNPFRRLELTVTVAGLTRSATLHLR